MTSILLEIRDLTVGFPQKDGFAPAIQNLSLKIEQGESLGLMGESGCGKSLLAMTLLDLQPASRIVNGDILFKGESVIPLEKRHALRGKDISMIFQEPMTSLNPVMKIGHQIAEVYEIHKKYSYEEARKATLEMMKSLHFSDPEKVFDKYPHHLSGGMRQRVLIAMALASDPLLLLADEPTTALDVTIQSQILDILKDHQKKMNMSTLFISHDLNIVSDMCQKVMVMYGGYIVESGTVEDVLGSPLHPYTLGLLNSRPKGFHQSLEPIPGLPPTLSERQTTKGCLFASRCSKASDICLDQKPQLISYQDHWSACHHATS